MTAHPPYSASTAGRQSASLTELETTQHKRVMQVLPWCSRWLAAAPPSAASVCHVLL
jgi:hypothetical protein